MSVGMSAPFADMQWEAVLKHVLQTPNGQELGVFEELKKGKYLEHEKCDEVLYQRGLWR